MSSIIEFFSYISRNFRRLVYILLVAIALLTLSFVEWRPGASNDAKLEAVSTLISQVFAAFLYVIFTYVFLSALEAGKLLEERRYRHWLRLRKKLLIPLSKGLDVYLQGFQTQCFLPICARLFDLVYGRGLRLYYEDLGRHRVTRELYEVLERLCGPPDNICNAGLEAVLEDIVEDVLKKVGVIIEKLPQVSDAIRCAIYVVAPRASGFPDAKRWLNHLMEEVRKELEQPEPTCITQLRARRTNIKMRMRGQPPVSQKEAEIIAKRIAEKLEENKLHEKLQELYKKLGEELNKALLYETLTDDCPYTLPEAEKGKRKRR